MPSANGERLLYSLEEVSRFGETTAGGLTRLAASSEDGQARDYVVAAARQAGCTVRIDAVGNIYMRRAGQDGHAPAILFGSHLDSQPLGGKYDGVYGVMAGLEVLRALAESNIDTGSSVELVVWTNEEGARFAPAMMGAAEWIGERASLPTPLIKGFKDLVKGVQDQIGLVGRDLDDIAGTASIAAVAPQT